MHYGFALDLHVLEASWGPQIPGLWALFQQFLIRHCYLIQYWNYEKVCWVHHESTLIERRRFRTMSIIIIDNEGICKILRNVYVLFCCLRSKLILFCFNTGAFHWNCQTILDLKSFGYHFSVASTWFCLYFIDWKKKGVRISLNIYILFVSTLIFNISFTCLCWLFDIFWFYQCFMHIMVC